ncbi:DJ-1/PfpI family protein [Alistipes sp.]|uniref:DJ-1/PfpI family protein n=1 Tax=Alistipes sp. TaxID=1872444 RepID=UPI003AB25CAA
MAKRVAVVAVNPVNGLGLFSYLEAFFEHKIACEVFAVAPTAAIRTNSGIALQADGVVADLRGRAGEFDALVFACGDAVPVFAQHASEPWNVQLLEVIGEFAVAGKIMAGHCGAGLLFELAGVIDGRRVASHPMVQGLIRRGVASQADFESDGRFITAQCEHTLPAMIPLLLGALE